GGWSFKRVSRRERNDRPFCQSGISEADLSTRAEPNHLDWRGIATTLPEGGDANVSIHSSGFDLRLH
ncbi:MAG TPA: hypothetical protein VGE93_04550, partial [Bryobacteraceae bacterium]